MLSLLFVVICSCSTVVLICFVFGAVANLQDVVIEQELGRGRFGAVYSAKWRGVEVAAKRLRDENTLPEFERECQLLR